LPLLNHIEVIIASQIVMKWYKQSKGWLLPK
jgi:hypothetical protein